MATKRLDDVYSGLYSVKTCETVCTNFSTTAVRSTGTTKYHNALLGSPINK